MQKYTSALTETGVNERSSDISHLLPLSLRKIVLDVNVWRRSVVLCSV